jgi:hypothetical protein
MNRDGHQQKSFFIGPEVEHTPAYSKKTLFVAGIHPAEDADTIERLAREYKTPHIFLGANHSFDATHYTEYFAKTWEDLVTRLLDRGFWVTLDYPAHQHETVLKMFSPGIWQSRQFVPLLSVRIPKVQTSSPNLTVKIDDVDFKATNPGVWCMHFHEVTDSNRFTDWQDYGTDVVLTEDQIAPQAGPAHTLPARVSVPSKPVYADINKPAVNLEGVKELIEKDRVIRHLEVEGEVSVETLRVIEEAFNDSNLGLDPEGKSKLKPDPDAPQETTKNDNHSPAEAAEAYASGAKEDPLGKTATKKTPVKTKK